MNKIIVILVVLLLFLQYKIWLGDGGIPEILQLQEEVDAAQAEANKLKERNKALEAEVKDLKMGLEAIEERARSELGMIGKDEVYYQVVETKPAKTRKPVIKEQVKKSATNIDSQSIPVQPGNK